MNVEEIREYCIAFSDATENLQWGDDLCFKVGGKIFVTVALTAVPQKVCFKCTPETFAELIEREDIRPAPYVGKPAGDPRSAGRAEQHRIEGVDPVLLRDGGGEGQEGPTSHQEREKWGTRGKAECSKVELEKEKQEKGGASQALTSALTTRGRVLRGHSS